MSSGKNFNHCELLQGGGLMDDQYPRLAEVQQARMQSQKLGGLRPAFKRELETEEVATALTRLSGESTPRTGHG